MSFDGYRTIPVTVLGLRTGVQRRSINRHSVLSRNILHKTMISNVREKLINSGALVERKVCTL